jgi:AraC family transcriptional regulator
MFRCPVTDPAFATAGLIDTFHVCFPRTAVWLEYEDTPRFVADATRATLYNPRQPFRRDRLSHDGDHTDWIALDPSVARDVVAHLCPADAEAERAFRFPSASVGQSTYLAQRALFNDAERGLADRLEVEERAIAVVSTVLAGAYARPHPVRQAAERTRALVESAREAILHTLFENIGVTELATRLNVSVFHLCRVFRAATGTSLHNYRRDLRLRAALGFIPEHRGQLSSLALRVGFNSHSHFTAAFRQAFGVAPSTGSNHVIAGRSPLP